MTMSVPRVLIIPLTVKPHTLSFLLLLDRRSSSWSLIVFWMCTLMIGASISIKNLARARLESRVQLRESESSDTATRADILSYRRDMSAIIRRIDQASNNPDRCSVALFASSITESNVTSFS